MKTTESDIRKQSLIVNIHMLEDAVYKQRSDFDRLWAMSVSELETKQGILIPMYNAKIRRKPSE